MKYSGLGYLISEGFRNMFKNKKSTATSIITMICAMFLFGVFFAIGENVSTVLNQVKTKQGMEVFIFDFTSEEKVSQLETQIKALDGVNTVTYKTKEKALESFKESMKNYKDAVAGMDGENNIFPASFVVTLTDLEKNDEIQNKIIEIGKNMLTEEEVTDAIKLVLDDAEITEPTIVKNIQTSNHTIEVLIKIVKGVRVAIGVIFVMLLIFSITIISNTIKLTVFARRKEISIMKYVGATDSFIRLPFIVEGIIIGIVSALITLLVIGVLYNYISGKIESSSVLEEINVTLLKFSELAKIISIVYCVLGVGVGVIGSSISMNKYLDV